MPEITDEEYECLYDAHYGENNPSELFKTIGSIVSRLESKRSEQKAELGPDYLENTARRRDRMCCEKLTLSVKEEISTFLKGRMEKCKPMRNVDEVINEIKHIHEALCGEVKDEQE